MLTKTRNLDALCVDSKVKSQSKFRRFDPNRKGCEPTVSKGTLIILATAVASKTQCSCYSGSEPWLQ